MFIEMTLLRLASAADLYGNENMLTNNDLASMGRVDRYERMLILVPM